MHIPVIIARHELGISIASQNKRPRNMEIPVSSQCNILPLAENMD